MPAVVDGPVDALATGVVVVSRQALPAIGECPANRCVYKLFGMWRTDVYLRVPSVYRLRVLWEGRGSHWRSERQEGGEGEDEGEWVVHARRGKACFPDSNAAENQEFLLGW